jgi:hypothetical protein
VDRRTFLEILGALSLAPRAANSAPAATGATVLYDDRATHLQQVRTDANDASSLWIRTRDLPAVNGFEVKPQGACRADVCIPIARTMRRGQLFDLTAFARKVGEAVVADTGARVWSFGAIEALRGSFLGSRVAPDVSIPDRRGRPVKLSAFHGRKVLLLTWASW